MGSVPRRNLILSAACLAACLAQGCAFSSTEYCVLSGRILRPDGKPASFCDIYLARSARDLARGSRAFSPSEREAFHVPGENLYRFVKADEQGRFRTVFRVRRYGAHPEVYYSHPLPQVHLQVESAPGRWARFTLDTEWGPWSSLLEGDLKPLDLGSLLLPEGSLSLAEPPPLVRAYLRPLEYPPLESAAAGKLLREGEKLYRAGRYEEAARRYLEAARLEPRGALAFYLTAESLFRAGKPGRARLFCRRAVTLDPWVGLGRFLLALILEKEGKGEQAREELLAACQLDPELAQARDRLELLDPRTRPFRKTPLLTRGPGSPAPLAGGSLPAERKR